MAFRFAGVSVPGPSDVLDAAQAAAGWSVRAVDVATSLPERLASVLSEVEQLIRQVSTVADRADALIVRASGVIDQAEQTVRRAQTITDAATAVVGRADGVTGDAHAVVVTSSTLTAQAGAVVEGAAKATSGAMDILDTYRPLAERAAPLAKRFVDDLTEEEVLAAIRLVDQLPKLTTAMEQDIMPILVTLDRVGPDVHELLEVLKDVRHAISGIPGFRFFRRRGAAEHDAGSDSADRKAAT